MEINRELIHVQERLEELTPNGRPPRKNWKALRRFNQTVAAMNSQYARVARLALLENVKKA